MTETRMVDGSGRAGFRPVLVDVRVYTSEGLGGLLMYTGGVSSGELNKLCRAS